MLESLRHPLLIKELRTRLRGKAVFAIQCLYLLALAVVIGVEFEVAVELAERIPSLNYGWTVGREMFSSMAMLQAVLLILVSPAITASAITMEREQKTFDLLLTTPVSHAQIVAYKLVSAIAYFLALLVISTPLQVVPVILGGVSYREVLFVWCATALCVLWAGCLGLYFSARFQRTIAAVMLSVLTVVIVLAMLQAFASACPAVASVSPLVVIDSLPERWSVKCYGIELPLWLPSVLLSLGLFFVCLCSCTQSLKHRHLQDVTGERAWGLLLYTAFLFFLGGSLSQPHTIPRQDLFSALTFLGIHLGCSALLALSIGAERASVSVLPASASFASRLLHRLTRGLLHAALFTLSGLLIATFGGFSALKGKLWVAWAAGGLIVPLFFLLGRTLRRLRH